MAQQQDIITLFIDDTMQKAGFNSLPANMLDNYKTRLCSLLFERLGIEAANWLSPSAQKEFGQFLSSQKTEKPTAIFEFFNARVNDFPNKVAGVLNKFQNDYLGMVKAVRA